MKQKSESESSHTILELIPPAKTTATADHATMTLEPTCPPIQASRMDPFITGLLVILGWVIAFAYVKVKLLGMKKRQISSDIEHHLDEPVGGRIKFPGIEDLSIAGKVHMTVNANYYRHLVQVVNSVITELGYTFVRKSADSANLANGLQFDDTNQLTERFARARLRFLSPQLSNEKLQDLVNINLADGYEALLLNEILEALFAQGFSLERRAAEVGATT